MPPVATDTIALLSLPLEWALYGFSTVLFGATLYVLVKQSTQVNMVMLCVTCAFFLLSTSHACISVARVYDGFILYTNTFTPPVFFANVGQQIFVAKYAIYFLQTLLGNGVLIYRAYVVWQRPYVVIIPILLWCSVATCGSVLLILLSRVDGLDIFALSKWVNSYFASSLAANLAATGLLAFRIWGVNQPSAKYKTHQNILVPILRLVADSGILYSVTLTTALVSFICNSNSEAMVVDMMVPIIAITFYLIILRLTLNLEKATSRLKDSAAIRTSFTSNSLPLQVHISYSTETNLGVTETDTASASSADKEEMQ